MTTCSTCGHEIKPNPDDCVIEDARSIYCNNKIARLTKHEWLIFEALRSRAGRVVSEGFLLEYTYDGRDEPDCRIIPVWVCRLRQKLKGTPFSIETERSAGYRLRRLPT